MVKSKLVTFWVVTTIKALTVITFNYLGPINRFYRGPAFSGSVFMRPVDGKVWVLFMVSLMRSLVAASPFRGVFTGPVLADPLTLAFSGAENSTFLCHFFDSELLATLTTVFPPWRKFVMLGTKVGAKPCRLSSAQRDVFFGAALNALNNSTRLSVEARTLMRAVFSC